MAPCCTNVVTPKMIRTGQMQIGDRIQLEDVIAEAPVISPMEPVASASAEPEPAPQQETPEPNLHAGDRLVQSEQIEAASSETPLDAAVQTAAAAPQMTQQQIADAQQNIYSQTIPNVTLERKSSTLTPSQISQSIKTPLCYDDMTPYMDQVTISTIEDSPMITVPQTPLTTQEFTESLDVESVQAFVGFLRTQIGRYMRIEQLVGSNTIEDRYGFLVGIGTNFVILQEITSGNIMVIDLFSIRLTYIYYSEPVLPEYMR